MEFLSPLAAFGQVVLIDISLAADNAITVGMATSDLPTQQRRQAVILGIGVATVLRIGFALVAVQLLHLAGLLLAGGFLLLWVGWKLFQEVRRRHQRRSGEASSDSPGKPKTLLSAVVQIIIADVSMSLDNVLAVAGVARDHVVVLALGLVLSVVLMGLASSVVARWTERYPLLGYAGLLVVLYTATKMIWVGAGQYLESLS